ncbi:MAG: hypothetical protein LM590_04665 [Thermofilum sp.]|nr:hypothetical protein [Thermofilum sp.]
MPRKVVEGERVPSHGVLPPRGFRMWLKAEPLPGDAPSPRLTAGFPRGVPGIAPSLGPGPRLLRPGFRGSTQTCDVAAGRGVWAGRPERGGESMPRESDKPGSDPGARRLVAQREHWSRARSNASTSSCSGDGGGVRIVPLNAWARLLRGLG